MPFDVTLDVGNSAATPQDVALDHAQAGLDRVDGVSVHHPGEHGSGDLRAARGDQQRVGECTAGIAVFHRYRESER